MPASISAWTNDYEWFIQLAKYENMTQAAQSIFLTQSTISRKLAHLEKDLGVELFDRVGKNLRINQYGIMIFEHFSRAQAEITQAFLRVRETALPPQGQITLGFLHPLGHRVIPQIIRKFLSHTPDIQFHFEQGTPLILEDHVISGSLDLAINSSIPQTNHKHADVLIWKKLFEQSLYLVVHENHRFADQERISLADCAKESFILPLHGFGTRDIIESLCATAGFNPRITLESSNIFTIMGFISAGLGISILPIDSLNLAQKNLRSIPLIDDNAKRDIGILWNSQNTLLPAATIFRDFCLHNRSTLYSAINSNAGL